MSLISVIIPSYNRASLIGETIESVINQTYSNWELIIVDDGSTDNSDEVIEEYLKTDNRIKYVRRPSGKPSGGNGARNYGFEIAKGNFIKWLDSDDLLQPNCLEIQLKKIQEDNSDVSFIRSRFFSIGKESNKIIKGKFWHNNIDFSNNVLEDFIFGKVRFSNNDGLWKSKIIGVKPYAENLGNSQEFLMIIKMLSKNIKVSIVEEVGVLIRDHQERMGNNRTYARFAYNQIYARHLALTYLKDHQNNNKKIKIYLLKSMLHYIFQSIKRSELSYTARNFKYFFKSTLIFF